MPLRFPAQLLNRVHPVRRQGMGVQVAFQQPDLLGHEGDLILHIHPIGCNFVGTHQYLPFAGDRFVRLVAGCCPGGAYGDLVLVRTGCANLRSIRGDQPQVNGVHVLPVGE